MNPRLELLVKLVSIVVHADEMTSPGGHELDRFELRRLVEDPEVVQWVKEMGAFAPLKRTDRS